MPIKHLRAPVNEFFFSYQGEGLFFSKPQIFVRFSGCNISCSYCDTKHGASQRFSLETLTRKVLSLFRKKEGILGNPGPSVAITGGEPLLQAEFLSEFLRRLRKHGIKILLETNGTMPSELQKVIRYVDTVSMDLKIPSSCGRSFWSEHRLFLKRCAGKVYVKLVVTAETKDSEISKAIDIVASASKNIPLVFQEVTPKGMSRRPSPASLHKWVRRAQSKLKNVYLIPQMHRIWGAR